MRVRGLILRGLGLVCAMVGTLVLWGAGAQAAVTYEYLSQIREVPVSSGAQLTGPFSGVNAMTVDSGDLWVAEQVEGTKSSRVDVFDASGGFLAQLNETAGLEELFHGIGVGHATGKTQVYVGATERIVNNHEGRVAVFAATGATPKAVPLAKSVFMVSRWTIRPVSLIGRPAMCTLATSNITWLTCSSLKQGAGRNM